MCYFCLLHIGLEELRREVLTVSPLQQPTSENFKRAKRKFSLTRVKPPCHVPHCCKVSDAGDLVLRAWYGRDKDILERRKMFKKLTTQSCRPFPWTSSRLTAETALPRTWYYVWLYLASSEFILRGICFQDNKRRYFSFSGHRWHVAFTGKGTTRSNTGVLSFLVHQTYHLVPVVRSIRLRTPGTFLLQVYVHDTRDVYGIPRQGF